MIAAPLRLFMCPPITDDAAAAMLASEECARDLTDTRVFIIGTGQAVHGFSIAGLYSDYASWPARHEAGAAAYRMADIRADDMDFAEVHDCFAIAEVIAYEELGFCAQRPPDPLVPRRRIHPIEECVNVEGEAVVPLNEADVHAAVERLRSDAVEAVAGSYLWSFLDPAHEQRTGRILREALPDVYVSLSSEVLPQIRAYERHSTTVLNAAVGPPLARYLDSLVRRLDEAGFRGVLLIMQSNGGVMSPEPTARFATNTLLSGPAGGATAGVFYGATHGLRNVLTVDMDGTSFDVCLIHDGRPATTTEGSIGGHRLALPNPGHSRHRRRRREHRLDRRRRHVARLAAERGRPARAGLLRPGRHRADRHRRRPGPGLSRPERAAGRGCHAGRRSRGTAIVRTIAEPLGLTALEAAEGIYRLVNANMAAALRVASVERGHDPREFALIVAGGAGPLHAGMLARELEVPLVVIPRQSSVFCAVGILLSDLQHDDVRTWTREWRHVEPAAETETINVRLKARGLTDPPRFPAQPLGPEDPAAALKDERQVHLAGTTTRVPVYDGEAFAPGFAQTGPALIEQTHTTLLVPPGYRVACDAYRNYVMHAADRPLDALLSGLRQ